jgi:hypothetical protein
MGTFTDNLLKLTDFPFSYSLISLLALIRYRESFLNQPLETLGPLLILMGFIATTLAILDPFGVLQEVSLKGLRTIKITSLRRSGFISDPEFRSIHVFNTSADRVAYPDSFFLPLAYSVVGASFADPLASSKDKRKPRNPFHHLSENIDLSRWAASMALLGLRDQTLRTQWVRREIDKITSLIYFLLVLSFFVLAVFLFPGFVDYFAEGSQGGNQTRGDGGVTITVGSNNAALSINNAIGPTAEGGYEQARIGIIVFSMVALGGVLYMLVKRIRELRGNALITLIYLLTREAYLVARPLIKIDDETIEKSLQEVEGYLNNGNWIMADFLTRSIRVDYHHLFSEKLSSKEDDRSLGIY